MGIVADRLAALTVHEDSPDGNISARIRAGRLGELTFRPGAYEWYAERDLEHQLARTATLLYIGHERGVQQIMEEAGLHRATDPSQARDEAQRGFLEQLRLISVTGSSPRGLVSFEIAGMASWRCRIVDGTLQKLPEPDFVAEVTAAAQDLLQRSQFEKGMLRNEYFGSQLAPPVRERIRRRTQKS